MKSIDYAAAVAEIEAAGLSDDAMAVALSGLNEQQLEIGRMHLAVVAYIQGAIREGMTLEYATRTAATIYGFNDERWARRLWKRHLQARRFKVVTPGRKHSKTDPAVMPGKSAG